MDTAFQIARWLSAGAFLFFGVVCLTSPHMVDEFARYRLASFRVLVGVLEIAGGLGLLLSPVVPALLAPAAGGLALLMVLGLITRISLNDSIVQMLPALALLLLTSFVLLRALGGNDHTALH